MRILLALLPGALGEIVLSNEWRRQHCVGDMRTRSLVVATATDVAAATGLVVATLADIATRAMEQRRTEKINRNSNL